MFAGRELDTFGAQSDSCEAPLNVLNAKKDCCAR